MKKILTLALCALLAACGGGGGDTPTQPAPVAQAAKPVEQLAATIAIYGDSLANLEASALRLMLPHSTILNHAVIGQRLHGMSIDADERADVTVIGYGTNDAHARIDNPTVESYQAMLLARVTVQQAKGHRVVIQTPPRTTSATPNDWTYPGGVAPFADAVRAVADKTGATLCDRYAESQTWPDAAFYDGIHYTDASTAAELLLGCVKTALKGL